MTYTKITCQNYSQIESYKEILAHWSLDVQQFGMFPWNSMMILPSDGDFWNNLFLFQSIKTLRLDNTYCANNIPKKWFYIFQWIFRITQTLRLEENYQLGSRSKGNAYIFTKFWSQNYFVWRRKKISDRKFQLQNLS